MKRGMKFFDFEVKQAAEDERSFWFTASTEDRDRDGDVIVAKGWKLNHFKKNPVILWAHRYDQPPVGKAVEVKVEDGSLRMLVRFMEAAINPFAEQVFQMVKAGYLRTMSVGFLPYKVEPLTDEEKLQRPEISWGKRIFAELMESSIVPVPANPMALQGRGFGDLVVKGFGGGPLEPTATATDGMEHPLLPFRDASGNIDSRLLRASTALLLGARGGLRISDEERQKCFALLRDTAEKNGVEFAGLEWRQYGQEELRKIFKDVWHEELLSLRLDAQAEEDSVRASAEAKTQAQVLTLAENGLKSMQETAAALSSLSGRLQ